MIWQVEVYVRNVAAHLEIQTQPEPSAILEFTPRAMTMMRILYTQQICTDKRSLRYIAPQKIHPTSTFHGVLKNFYNVLESKLTWNAFDI